MNQESIVDRNERLLERAIDRLDHEFLTSEMTEKEYSAAYQRLVDFYTLTYADFCEEH